MDIKYNQYTHLYSKKNKDDYQILVTTYFNYRNVYKMGWLKYIHIRNLIKYITQLKNHTSVRYIFQSLLNQNIFEKKILYRQIYYRYNPLQKKDRIDRIIISFE